MRSRKSVKDRAAPAEAASSTAASTSSSSGDLDAILLLFVSLNGVKWEQLRAPVSSDEREALAILLAGLSGEEESPQSQSRARV